MQENIYLPNKCSNVILESYIIAARSSVVNVEFYAFIYLRKHTPSLRCLVILYLLTMLIYIDASVLFETHPQ